jgi:lysophospholipase L1-like esterase
MQAGTSLVYRIFTFTVFIAILAFIAGSLNLSAKRDYYRSAPYTAGTMPPSERPSPSEKSPTGSPDVNAEMPFPVETEIPVTEPAETEFPVAEPAETEFPVTEPAETELPVTEPKPYTFAVQLPENGRVDKSYFTNSLFIGDSRTVGFCNFTGITRYCYARVALNIKSILTTAFIEDNSSGETVTRTVLDTIRKYPKSFDKVYISFGVNEYSWAGTTFIACYEYFINELLDILPEGTPIYVLSILPVNEKEAQKNGYRVKNSQLDAHNSLLADMAERLNVYFVNTAEAVTADDSFSLPDGKASDGVHINKSVCDIVYDYLLTHTAP